MCFLVGSAMMTGYCMWVLAGSCFPFFLVLCTSNESFSGTQYWSTGPYPPTFSLAYSMMRKALCFCSKLMSGIGCKCTFCLSSICQWRWGEQVIKWTSSLGRLSYMLIPKSGANFDTQDVSAIYVPWCRIEESFCRYPKWKAITDKQRDFCPPLY